MNIHASGRRLWLPLILVLAAVAALVAAVLAGSDSQPSSAEAAPVAGEPSTPPVEPAALTPDEQARADLELLVREYYAAENAVFLDPSSDPSAALEPYLRNPASAARIADILSFRNAGHTLESRETTVLSVDLLSTETDSQGKLAYLLVCKSLLAKGTDGSSGAPAVAEDQGLIKWVAGLQADGSWRLREYEGVGGAEGVC